MTRTPWPWEEGEGNDGETEVVSEVTKPIDGLVPLTSSSGRTVYVTQETMTRMEKRYKGGYNQARPDILGREEAAQLSEQIGVPVETWSDAKRLMRERNIRFVEKGDNRDRWERERKEWLADGKQGEQPTPNATVLGHMKSPDIRKMLKEQGYA